MSYLLIWFGQKGRDIYNTWTDITDEDKSKTRVKHITIASKLTSVQKQTLSSPDLNFTAVFKDRQKLRRRSSQIYASWSKTAISKILAK